MINFTFHVLDRQVRSCFSVLLRLRQVLHSINEVIRPLVSSNLSAQLGPPSKQREMEPHVQMKGLLPGLVPQPAHASFNLEREAVLSRDDMLRSL